MAPEQLRKYHDKIAELCGWHIEHNPMFGICWHIELDPSNMEDNTSNLDIDTYVRRCMNWQPMVDWYDTMFLIEYLKCCGWHVTMSFMTNGATGISLTHENESSLSVTDTNPQYAICFAFLLAHNVSENSNDWEPVKVPVNWYLEGF